MIKNNDAKVWRRVMVCKSQKFVFLLKKSDFDV